MPRLEAEIDFDHRPGMVALRIYLLDDDGDRRIMRAQQLHNLAARMKKATDHDYPEPDNRLMRYLSSKLDKPGSLRSNLNLMTLERQRFERMLERFDDVPGRFVMKGTRQPYSGKAAIAGMHFELNCQGKESVLSALVDLPDGHGKPWSLVRRDMKGRSTEAVINGQMVKLELPLPRELLDQVFGRDNPRVPTAAIEQHLPILLKHRLDLLRGPSVDHEEENGDARLELRCEGADISLRPMVGQAFVLLDEAVPVCRLVQREKRFVVVKYDSMATSPLREMISRLPVKERDGDYLLPGDARKVLALCKALRKPPKGVDVQAPPELQELLKGPLRLETDVVADEGRGWFQLEFTGRAGNVTLSMEEMQELASKASDGIVRTRAGEWLQINPDDLGHTMSALNRLRALERRRRPRTEAEDVLAEIGEMPNLNWQRSAADLRAAVQKREPIPEMSLRDELASTLRDYQRQGTEFLFNRFGHGVGALLADDMGLGKTIQVLACLEALKAIGRLSRALVVCPASVLTVWRDEALKFCPSLEVVPLWGTPDNRLDALLGDADVLVCTYAVARNDAAFLGEMEWDVVILDEAQHIKNPKAQVTAAVKGLPSKMRLALTGTPLENRLLDLWSIVDFLNPGYLGTPESFQTNYGQKTWRRQDLPERLAPIMLRRTKDEVAPELPPRTEETISIPLAPDQAALYSQQLLLAREKVVGKGALDILAALTRLRQISCHPSLLDKQFEEGSAKLECLMEMVSELLAEDHSVLVFSQFTSMLDIIAEEMKERNWHHYMLTGETPTRDRQYLVRRFTEDKKPSVFLLSLRAAGTGLTLSKADYVFIFDPWWNPAVENQAIDRTHRIGQDKPVMAYRMVSAGTVEEKVAALQEEKRKLFAETIDAVDTVPEKLSAAELLELLS